MASFWEILAEKGLPILGGALGSLVAPGVGTAIGGALGGIAGNTAAAELAPDSQPQQIGSLTQAQPTRKRQDLYQSTSGSWLR